MSNTPPRRGERRPAPRTTPKAEPQAETRPARPAQSARANRTTSPPRQPRRDDRYDRYERDSRDSRYQRDDRYDDYPQSDRSYRPARQGGRNVAPQGRRAAYSRTGYSRYAAPRRDVFPVIMGAVIGMLVVGILIVGYLLLTRPSDTGPVASTDNGASTQPTALAANDASGQATAASMGQTPDASLNVAKTQTMAALRPAGGLGTPMPDEGNAHVGDGEAITYKNYPPTSGTHYNTPLQAGFYDTTQQEGNFVHSLEHGYIVIYYKPDLPAATKQQLKDAYSKLPLGKYGKSKAVIVPYTNMPTPMAIAAWDRLMLLNTFNYDEIQAFYQQYVDKGPEDVP